MVFYRKYRPQTIDELDSQRVRETLAAILSSESYPHALLFTGPKGLGKTSTARIVAKVLNCEDKKDIEPCNACDQCKSITAGTNIDVLEIDGASNRGIDEIRDLREKIRLLPAKAKKKVYIIDEVHMLTTEAFNALLKTLEEPPSHALFILCTTEQHKLPATISSRCFQINFTQATKDELLRSFTRIAKIEKISIDQKSLETIASLSDGSFRDGVKILEEILSFAKEGKVTPELIESKYALNSTNEQVKKLLSSLKNKDKKEALKTTSSLLTKGVDVKFLIDQSIFYLHNIILKKAGVLDEETEDIDFELNEIKKLVMLLTKASSEVKYSVVPELPLELVTLEWCSDLEEKSIETIEKKEEKKIEKIENKEVKSDDLNIWSDLIEKVKIHNHSIAGLLRGGNLKSLENGKATIETNFKFHKDKLEENSNKKLVEKVFSEITGEQILISILLKEK